MSPFTGLLLTLLLLAGNGFFVASEFALVAARRHRLERAAARGSRAASAAVAGIRELSLMLAGAQLGITVCSLGLGAVSEPLIAGGLGPLLRAVGLPGAVAHTVAFLFALGVVTFLHMVIGEMAPKSWAIAHPERSAALLALPFRGFTVAVRPVLAALNGAATLVLRALGARPREGAATPRDPGQLRHLVEESRRLDLIGAEEHAVLTRALEAPDIPIAPLVTPAAAIAGVPAGASAAEVVDTSARTGRTRLVVWRGDDPAGVVHVRDAYLARGRGVRATAAELLYRLPELPVGASVPDAVAVLRAAHGRFAVVRAPDGALAGLIGLDDLLATLLAPEPGPR